MDNDIIPVNLGATEVLSQRGQNEEQLVELLNSLPANNPIWNDFLAYLLDIANNQELAPPDSPIDA